MIIDNINNAERYFASMPLLQKAFENIASMENAECGRIDIEGDTVYASVQECVTAPAGDIPFEHHKEYIDVHFVISGEERIDFCKRDDCDATTEFDVKNDYELCAEPGNFATSILYPGDFAVLWPGEAHRPKVAVSEVQKLRKIVFKIKAQSK